MKGCISLAFIVLFITYSATYDIKIVLPQGEIGGSIVYDILSNKSFQQFIGIPYAQSRPYQRPKGPKSWNGILNCTRFHRRCYDVPINGKNFPTLFSKNLIQGSDCLTLNVFSPFVNNASTKYPVLIFIHGGAFSWGSSYDVKNPYLLAAKDVVLVTFNYRLGPWGFLQNGDQSLVGNYAMWDKIAVLKWTKLNIAKFNGDPNEVTLMGQSAGAVSVTLLSLSPVSRNFFQKAIIMSGGYSAKWLPPRENLINASRVLLENNGCFGRTNAEVLECLKNITEEQMQQKAFELSNGHPIFGPNVDDKDLFPKPLSDLFVESPIDNVILGSTLDETGLFLFPPTERLKSKMSITNPNNYSTDDFVNLFTTIYPEPESGFVSKGEKLFQILEQYSLFGETNSSVILQKALTMTNHYFAFKPIVDEVLIRQNYNQTVWLYSFDYFHENDFPKKSFHKGAYHMMDLKYLFNVTVTDKSFWSETDYNISDSMTSFWANFVKHGNPNPLNGTKPGRTKWLKTVSEKPFRFMSINEYSTMKSSYNGYG